MCTQHSWRVLTTSISDESRREVKCLLSIVVGNWVQLQEIFRQHRERIGECTPSRESYFAPFRLIHLEGRYLVPLSPPSGYHQGTQAVFVIPSVSLLLCTLATLPARAESLPPCICRCMKSLLHCPRSGSYQSSRANLSSAGMCVFLAGLPDSSPTPERGRARSGLPGD